MSFKAEILSYYESELKISNQKLDNIKIQIHETQHIIDKINSYPKEILDMYEMLTTIDINRHGGERIFNCLDSINKILHNYKFNSKIEDVINNPEGDLNE